MANALFDIGREFFLGGDLDWDAHNFKLVFVDHGVDTPVPATDQNLSDITAGARVATSGNLANKTKTAGVADADDITLTAVTGASIESLVIYRDTGVAGTSTLVVFIDTATGLPFTPSGSDVTVRWDSGANRIFKL
ncbi:MAG: hypothetical protein QOI20_3267 [Acidimicrobiaceae bacterium]|jgi:hypothetical protein|nr:hypothetical protein [Acidimicrobiaceae bacterium]